MIVREKEVKDYLSTSKIGSFAINPYIGCPHACKYCYACFMKRFTHHLEPWGEFIDIKRCDKKIDLRKIAGKSVFISSVTDPYNPYEAEYGITRSILEQLVDADCDLYIATKSKLILRDLDLLKRMKNLSVAISINTLNDDFRRDMDCASSISERLNILQVLHDEGLYTILFMSPIFINITDWQAIIDATKEYADKYWFEDLNLRGSYKNVIMDYVAKKYPQAHLSFERIYKYGDKTEIWELENKIIDYCEKNYINYSNYFHHDEIIRNLKGGVLAEDN